MTEIKNDIVSFILILFGVLLGKLQLYISIFLQINVLIAGSRM